MNRGYRDLIRHSAIYGLGQLLSRLASFLMLPVYTRFLTPADYGCIAVLDLLVAFFGVIVSSGLFVAVNRYHFSARDERERDAVWWTGLVCVAAAATLVVVPLWLPRETIAALLLGSEVAAGPHYLALVLATLWVNMLGQFADLYLRVRKWSGLSVALSLAGLLSNIALNVAFLIAGMGIGGVLLANLISNGAFALFRLVILMASRGAPSLDVRLVRAFLAFGFPIVVSGVLALGMHQADRYFIRLHLGNHAVGIYSVGYSIGQAINTLVLVSFTSVWSVAMYEIAERPDARRTFARVYEYFASGLMLAMLGLALMARPLVAVMAAPEFAPAAEIIPIVGLAYLFFSLHEHFKVPVLLSNRTSRLLPAFIAGFAVNIAGNLLLLPLFRHPAAAAWISVATFAVFSFTGLALYRSLDRIPYPHRSLGLRLCAMIATYLVARPFLAAADSLAVEIAAASAVWLAWVAVLGLPLTRRLQRAAASQAASPELLPTAAPPRNEPRFT